MTAPDWSTLRHALAQHREQGLALPLWCRDDDAIEPTPQLDRLERLSDATGVQVHLAVVPRNATRALATRLATSHAFVPLVHGWQHVNHTLPDAKKSEFGQPRAEGAKELAFALARMQNLFVDLLLPVFVPPWNRIDPAYLPELAALGYRGLSTFLPRAQVQAHPGLVQINTHVDPIAWRSTRDLIDPQTLIDATAAHITARTSGDADNTEPLGLLTHHLVHSDAVWSFCEQLLKELLDGGAHPQPLAPLLEPTT